MAPVDQPESPGRDESWWAYLSVGSTGIPAQRELVAELEQACAKSGWRAVSHPPPRGNGHAVEHADVVIAMIGGKDDMADAELTLAYSHGRPVVGLQIGEAPLDSQPRILLAGYERARMVICDTPGECAVSLREALSDPAFVRTIRQAA